MINFLTNNIEKEKKEFLLKIGSYDNWYIPEVWPEYSYPGNSIFFSEAFILYRLAQHFSIDVFIESGVYRGGSTSLWGRLFPDISIYSIDYVKEGRNPRQKWNRVRAHLSPLYPNITFIEGDGTQVIPQLIEKNSNKKIGVFVDGPKDALGFDLAKKSLSYDNVYFSSLHDYIDDNYFHSRIPEYRNLVPDLDKDHSQIKKYPNGPGLTVLTKELL